MSTTKSKDPMIRLVHIIKAMDDIFDYTKDINLQDFENKKMIRDAVERNFQIIGEASKYIPDTIKCDYHHIPWHKMQGFRNVIVHDYDGLDVISIWYTVKKDLPPVYEALKKIPITGDFD